MEEPWKRIALTEEQLQVIYREWGIFYTHKQKLEIAADYYNVSLSLKTDPKALYHRSRCKRSISQAEEALNDSKAALEHDPQSQPFALEVCDALYQLNQFENCKCELFNNSLKFKGLKLTAFNNRGDVLAENFNDTLGDSLGSFILENEKHLYKASEEMHEEQNIDDHSSIRKVLKDEDECDVLSALEKEDIVLSSKETARRRRAFSVFNEIYMRGSWVDVLFLRALKDNPNLLLPQSKWSTPQLKRLTQGKYDDTMRFLKMLHARSPLYTEKIRKCPDKKLAKKKAEEYLFRVQYQVHRNMLTILKRIKYLRQLKQMEKLTRYVEEVMGDYVVLKTHRVMPWKFEFINEVYNLLALSYLDQYLATPKNLTRFKQQDRLAILLGMPKEKDKEPMAFIFGDKSTYHDEDADDLILLRQRKFIIRMEKRLVFSKFPVERSYIFHTIARSYLKQTRLDESYLAARKSIDEAKRCNSFLWTLVGLLLICKSHAVLRKIEKIKEALTAAREVAKRLKSPKILAFVDLLLVVNEQDAQLKRQNEELLKTKSRASLYSSTKTSSTSVLKAFSG